MRIVSRASKILKYQSLIRRLYYNFFKMFEVRTDVAVTFATVFMMFAFAVVYNQDYFKGCKQHPRIFLFL